MGKKLIFVCLKNTGILVFLSLWPLPALPAQWNALEIIFHRGEMRSLFHRGASNDRQGVGEKTIFL
jgi:hypothetical protein